MAGPVHSVSQAFAVLRQLAAADAMTLSDVGRMVGLSPSSCLNILKTLVNEGVVERDERTKRYGLTPAWRAVNALQDRGATQLVERARPMMAQLATSAEVVVGLWKAVSRDRMQLAAREESNAGMRLSLADDQRQPLGAGAAGRALAVMEGIGKAEMARRFALVRWQTDLSFDLYSQQIEEAAKAGFAVDQGYAHSGVTSVAVGVAGVSPGFCLSASFVSGSRQPQDVRELGDALIGVREELMRIIRPQSDS